MGDICTWAGNVAMQVGKSWTKPRILPFIGLFLAYGLTRPLPYDFLHDPILMVVIKTSSIWYLVFYVQIIKDLWPSFPTHHHVLTKSNNANDPTLVQIGNDSKRSGLLASCVKHDNSISISQHKHELGSELHSTKDTDSSGGKCKNNARTSTFDTVMKYLTRLNVFQQHRAQPYSPQREEAYRQFFTLAFVISSMGDAFMIFPSTFIPGVLSYGSAHLLSIVGFQNRFTRPRFAWLIYPYNIIGVLSILVWIRNIQMMVIIFVYTLMLTTVMFYSLANLETRPSIQNLLAAIGAAFYVWSDTMIAYDKWIFALPLRNTLIWSTYFFAQMNLALSV